MAPSGADPGARGPSAIIRARAEVAESVDAADSKSAALKSVWVRVPPSAPDRGHARRRGLPVAGSTVLHLGHARGVVHEDRQRTRDPGELEQLVGLHLAERDCAPPGPEPFDRLAAIDKHPTAAIGHDTEHVTFHFALRVRKMRPGPAARLAQGRTQSPLLSGIRCRCMGGPPGQDQHPRIRGPIQSGNRPSWGRKNPTPPSREDGNHSYRTSWISTTRPPRISKLTCLLSR